MVPSVTMYNFARFYQAKPHRKKKVAQDKREEAGGPNNFQEFRDAVEQSFLSSDHIRVFRRGLPGLVESQRPDLKGPYQEAGNACLSYCGDPDIVAVTSLVEQFVQLGGLFIRIKPDILMERRDGTQQAAKMLFGAKGPSEGFILVQCYLMSLIPSYRDCFCSVWKVRQQRIVQVHSAEGRAFLDNLADQVKLLRRIWRQLYGDPCPLVR